MAKNYLKEDEIAELNRIITMWLDFAEDQARRRRQIFLADWEQRLDDFLRFNDRDVLTHNGVVRMQDAKQRAEAEYDLFVERRRALLEAEAERTGLQELEDAARQFPTS